MRWLMTTLLAALALLALLWPASGATVIFYAEAENSYGWCAGYTYGEGESCAREQCLNYGSACRLAIECDPGWNATAFAPDGFSGFGAACQWPDAASARIIALASCIYASRRLCTTSEAFDRDGDATSENSNQAFDIAWYTQSLLSALGYDIGEIDGQIGSRTRAAIAAFQTSAGLEATGESGWPLIDVMLYSSGGTRRFVEDIAAGRNGADPKVVATYTFAYAGSAAPDVALGAELAALPDADRLAAMAVLLNRASAACAFPATTAAWQDETASDWGVTCAEGSYRVSLTNDGAISVASADGRILRRPARSPRLRARG